MNKQGLILIGGGGHCRSCMDVIEQEGKYAIQGVLDAQLSAGDLVASYPVLGGDDKMEELAVAVFSFLITVGQIKSSAARLNLFEKLSEIKAILATVISPHAYIAGTASVQPGTIVMHGAIVNAAAAIGMNAIINTRALIEHDAVIGDHVHVSTAAIVNGGCQIGEGAFIGSGATIAHGVSITSHAIIGAGAAVVKNISEPGRYAGCPAKKI